LQESIMAPNLLPFGVIRFPPSASEQVFQLEYIEYPCPLTQVFENVILTGVWLQRQRREKWHQR
jgi:hypothetical protein